jgi:hypothetical protein
MKLENCPDRTDLGYYWTTARHAIVAFVFTYALVVTCVLGLNFHSVFNRPVIEQGDIAANALAIREAKSFSRITGNYSRFGFDHPGPFFLYVYAAGEYVFYDTLALVPSPHNAHVLAGVLLQAAFFALALALVSYWVRSALFPPLALLFCAIYFALLNASPVSEQLRGSLFISIWPPHWVMFPVLCFLSACASLAAGHSLCLPIAVFCGSVIVHGYINTPIYIAPIFFASYISHFAIRKFRKGESISESMRSGFRLHVFTAIILAIFIAPIVLDALRGEASNLARIIAVMEKYEGARHSLGEVIPYVANYFTFLSHGMSHLKELGNNPWDFLGTQWKLLAFWILLPLIITFGAVLTRNRTGGADTFHMGASLAVAAAWISIAAYGAIGTIGWLYFYICYHLFAVPVLLLILLSATLSRVFSISTRLSRYATVLVLLLLFSLPLVPAFGDAISGYDWRLDRRERLGPVKDLPAAIEKALSTSVDRPTAVILDLVSQSSDGKIQDVALPAVHFGPSIGILLERAGIPFFANTTRVTFFGESRVLNSQHDLASLGNYVVWRVLPIAEAGEDAIPLGSELALLVVKNKMITGLQI